MTLLADRIAALSPEQRELLLRRLAGAAGTAVVPAPDAVRPRADGDAPAPTSPGQENLWMLDQLDPGSPSGNISYPVRLRGPLNAAVLERAFAEVVRRHDALRTTFPLADGVPVQRVVPGPFAGIQVHDLSDLPRAEREAKARARVATELRHRFSLEEGPLLRASLVRLAPDEHVLVVLLHHIVGDGWSLDVLFRELAALYGAFSRGLPSPLPPLALQYGDWAAWQRARLAGGRMEELVAYWRRTLAGAPPVLELPADRPRPESFIQHTGWLTGIHLPRETADGLRALCRAEVATPFAGLLALFKALLLRWTGEADLVVGTVVASRTQVEMEALIGYFINALALRTRLGDDPSFRQALRRVRDTVSGAYAHQDLPFEVLLEELRPEVRAGYPPVVQVQFILQNATGRLRLPGLEAEELPVDRSAAEVDLTLNAMEQEDGGVRFSLEYSTDLWDRPTMERLAQALLHLAAAALASPDQPLSTLALPEGAMEGLGSRGLDAPDPPSEAVEAAAPGREWHPLALSARSADGLGEEAARVAAHLHAHPELPLAGVALALARRPSYPYRSVVLVRRDEDAAAALEGQGPGRMLEGMAEGSGAPVAFLFPGEDSVRVGMGRGLYDAEPVFRAELDRCAEWLRPHLGVDVREALYPADPDDADAAERLGTAELAQPAAVAFGLALAAVWASWGVLPEAAMGHGVGELTAACVAGVLPPEDALELAAARGRCIGELPPGARLEVALPPAAVEPFLVPGAAVAEVNAPSACVVGGREGPVAEAERRLRAAGHPARRRPAPFGFGSPLAKLASARLLPVAARMRWSPPRLPLLSAATGTWLADGEATDPAWWAFQFRQTMRFGAGVAELLREPGRLLLEVGPGTALRDLVAGRGAEGGAAARVVASLGEGDAGLPEAARLLGALARLWVRGASPHWPAVWAGEGRPPVPVPGADAARAPAVPAADGGAEDSPGACIHDLVHAQAARAPDAVAVEHEGRPLTCRGLDERAERLARRLAAAGAGPEARVGVLLERSGDAVAAQLGALRAGCAFVPLDPAYPDDRLAYLAADAGVRVVVTRAALRDRVPAGVEALCVDEDDGMAIDTALPRARPGNAAYVVYTSGSTGAPRGVVVPHAALVNHARAVADEYGLRPGDRVLQFASPAFDVALEEVYPTLLRGATLVIRDERAMDSLASFLAFARDRALTVWNLPSPYWHELVGEMERSGATVPETLRLLVVGSEAASAAALAAWRRMAGEGVAFRNAYGPTEATVTATVYAPPAEGPTAEGATVPVGAPLANVAAYVLDPRGEPVAEGAPGELYLGGAGVARGYLGRPAATAAVFVPDPFRGRPGARMYRTGDRVRLRGGALEFMGRLDRQVKVRGFRVEPEEIEAALRAHPAVREAAVLLREDAPGRARLVAYAAADEVPADVLRVHLAGRLPAYMVPDALLVLPSLPVTPGGKVDRRALPAPPAPSRAPGEAPHEGTEASVAAVWREVLRVEGVSRGEPFLALGGNSLLAAQVVSRLQHALGVEISVPALLEASTVAGVAALVARGPAGPRTAPPRPRTGPVEGDWPLSLSQERALFMSRLQPDSLAYQFQAALRFTGPLDPGALERSLEEVVRRHAVFRTSFPRSAGEPVQRVHPPPRIRLPREDLRAVPAEARRAEADRRIRAELERPFDLERAPLVRWRLFRLEDDVWEMAHVEHHIVHDGWSFNVFLAELLVIYRAFARGAPSPLPEPALHFADYAVWQREWMQGPEAADQLEYWRGRLAGAPSLLELPTDRPRPAVQRFRGGVRRMELSAAEAEALRTLGRAHDATLFTTLLAGFALLLHRYSGQADVCIGSGVANRRFREVEGLVGMLVNSVVLRVGLDDDPTVAELLARTRATTLQAFARQDLPFDRVVQALAPQRSLGHNPLHQVTFSFDDARMPEVDVPGLEVTVREGLSNGSAKYDLNVIVAPRAGTARFSDGWQAGGLTVLWEYDADLFDAATMDRMLGQYRRLLRAAAEAPGTRAGEVPLLDDAERDQVLHAWNRTDVPYPAESSIHGLFAEQAARTPGAVAVVMDGRSVTYGELEARANRLANHLAARGVGLETRVGLCMERGPDMVAALLAILKAGGAYVPLDPAYPPGRLAFMLADSGVAVLLTQESLRGALPVPDGVVTVSLDGERDRIAAESAEPPPVQGGPGALAYVIYTSGSTGTPRGVAVEHRGVVRLVRGADYAELGPDEVILQAAPVSFDASTFELWAALLNGGRLVLVPGASPSLQALGGAIVRHGVTTLWLTAGLFRVMVQERLETLRGVRQLLAGGDVLPVDAVARVRARFPALRLVNGYGPTENTTFTCCHTVDDAWSGGPVPIGTPVSNTRVYVLDAALRPVPAGVPGELYAGGDGVARGYPGRPALTAARFVPDPFGGRPGARLYRTGDRVRWRGDGTVEFLGRLDGQVKVRGFRVEPGEVEAALRRHPRVRDCAVVACEDAGGERRLVAYVAGGADADDLRAHLRGALPAYMVPAAFVALEALPLTPNGKLDRGALPAPEHAPPAEGYVAPRTPAEQVLAGIWAEVLRLDRVGVEDDFYDLGGHSLLVTRVVSRVHDAFGVELPLRVPFEAPTVAQQAERILALSAARSGAGAGA